MDSETRMWERLFRLLAQDDWDQTVYVYRMDASGKMTKPYLAKWGMHAGLLDSIRDDFGSGEIKHFATDLKKRRACGSVLPPAIHSGLAQK